MTSHASGDTMRVSRALGDWGLGAPSLPPMRSRSCPREGSLAARGRGGTGTEGSARARPVTRAAASCRSRSRTMSPGSPTPLKRHAMKGRVWECESGSPKSSLRGMKKVMLSDVLLTWRRNSCLLRELLSLPDSMA